VDGFKGFNDSFGHLAGDNILCRTASKLNATLHAGDTLCRLGGDEFLIVSSRDPAVLAASISLSFREPAIAEGGIEIDVHLSIGSSTFPADADGTNGAEAIPYLLRAADRRMYKQKRDRQGDRRSIALAEN
jgi:diguanylate cyclase (GGDEF)-like protein